MKSSRPSSANCSLPSETRLQAALALLWMVMEARIDPDAFIEMCFADPSGAPVRQGRVHRELQAFLTAHHHALVELPRDHGKSTQVCSRIVWELARRPGLRVKIVCASEALAAERGRFLREALTANRRVRLVFPDLRAAKPWSDTRLTVRRPSSVIGPSVAAIGIGAASTGARADLLVCDDIVDVKSLSSRAERNRVKEHFRNNLMNLLEPDGRFWGLCTPWHREDLNAELKHNGSYALFRRAVGEALEPVWPERWPRQRLQERQGAIGAASFARGYRLVPLADEDVAIRPDWVRFWTEEAAPERVVLSVDPALSTKARADASALVTLARTAGNQVRCLEALARRVAAPDLVALLDEADRRWQPDVILFESNAAFAAVRDLLVRHARFGPKVKSVTQTRDKEARVATFSVSVQNGSFRLRGCDTLSADPGQQALFEEMTTFPVGEHDDLLDAAATGMAFLLEQRDPRVWVY